MATIDGFLLGGRSDLEGYADHGAAVAYRLRAPCQVSRSDKIDGWIVESVAGKSTIVARSPQSLNRREAIAAGTESIQRYLDFLSYESARRERAMASASGCAACSSRSPPESTCGHCFPTAATWPTTCWPISMSACAATCSTPSQRTAWPRQLFRIRSYLPLHTRS